jgi:hypothetical protein
MSKQSFDSMVSRFLLEEPLVAPAPTTLPRPTTVPNPTRRTAPSTPNPSPFRRQKPGSMPSIKPKADTKSKEEFKQEIANVINRYTKFIEN